MTGTFGQRLDALDRELTPDVDAALEHTMRRATSMPTFSHWPALIGPRFSLGLAVAAAGVVAVLGGSVALTAAYLGRQHHPAIVAQASPSPSAEIVPSPSPVVIPSLSPSPSPSPRPAASPSPAEIVLTNSPTLQRISVHRGTLIRVILHPAAGGPWFEPEEKAPDHLTRLSARQYPDGGAEATFRADLQGVTEIEGYQPCRPSPAPPASPGAPPPPPPCDIPQPGLLVYVTVT